MQLSSIIVLLVVLLATLSVSGMPQGFAKRFRGRNAGRPFKALKNSYRRFTPATFNFTTQFQSQEKAKAAGIIDATIDFGQVSTFSRSNSSTSAEQGQGTAHAFSNTGLHAVGHNHTVKLTDQSAAAVQTQYDQRSAGSTNAQHSQTQAQAQGSVVNQGSLEGEGESQFENRVESHVDGRGRAWQRSSAKSRLSGSAIGINSGQTSQATSQSGTQQQTRTYRRRG